MVLSTDADQQLSCQPAPSEEEREMPNRRRMFAGLMAGTGLMLTACAPAGTALNTGPEASSIVCTPSDAQGRVAIAHVHVHADGSRPVLIRDVTLKQADNLRIEKFGVLPDDEDGFRGVLQPSDPDAQISTNHEIPAGEQATVQLMVALVNPLESGVIESVALEYDDPGRTGSKTATAGLNAEVFPAGDAAPDNSMCEPADE